jgi:aldehyde dehydrogenase (NAD+)
VKFNETASKIKLGDQMVEGTEHGPLVDSIQFDRVMSFIERGKTEGAHCVVGGNRSGTSGYFIPPTVFTNVLPSMSIATQEIFGPVACIMKFQNVDEVVKLANDSEYGLAAGIHTKNAKLAAQVSADLEAGTVWINCYNVFSEAVPFGGFKQSGIGRELGQEGVMEYLQVKSVIINVA